MGDIPYPSTQGSQVYVRSLLKRLAALGHRVVCCAMRMVILMCNGMIQE